MTDVVFSLANRLLQAPWAKKIIWTNWYRFCARKFPLDFFKYINFGYAPKDKTPLLALNEKDEEDRYFIQLYHHLLSQVALTNKEILEVGCGRGGGSHFISQYTDCKHILGLDRCKEAIQLARQWFKRDNLNFQVGNAQLLPFEDNRFDIIINVESSHCYENMHAFLNEVKRVLKPNGFLLLTDFRHRKELPKLETEINQSPLKTVAEMDITPYVLNSLRFDDARKRALIQSNAPKYLHWISLDLAACIDSRVFKALQNGDIIYKSFKLQA